MSDISGYVILGPAVGPRSHFLPTTPIVTVAEKLPTEGAPDPYVSYVMHHEYIHYEQHLTWPILLMRYIDLAFTLTRTFARLHSVEVLPCKFAARLSATAHQLKYGTQGWNDSKVAAEQSPSFKIGLSALLEGHAILDCFLKPSDSELAGVGVAVVESLFKSRDLVLNREHIIGTESCLAAVGLGNQRFRDIEDRILLEYAAMLPSCVVEYPLGRAVHSLGIPLTGWQYSDVHRMVTQNTSALLSAYSSCLYDSLHMAFAGRSASLWFKDNYRYRDTYIITAHALLDVCHRIMRRALPMCAPAFPFLSPIHVVLGLMKIFEAMNAPTLSKYGIPYARPDFIPVPAILFSKRAISGLWIDHAGHQGRDFTLRWAGGSLNPSKFLGWLSWCTLAILHALHSAIQSRQPEMVCPFRAWVRERYREVGIDDDSVVSTHLAEMCNGSFRVLFSGQSSETRVIPSVDYCRCSTSRAPDKALCIFRSVVGEVISPNETIEDVEQKLRNAKTQLNH